MKTISDKSALLWPFRWTLTLAIAAGLLGCEGHILTQVPYSDANPIVYDNDEAIDAYTDEYMLALASAGEIQLKGIMTSSPITAWSSAADYDRIVNDRQTLVAVARASGLQHIPDPVQGPMGQLQRPASGRIEDTRPIGAVGSWLIVAEARKASPQNPLVVVVGGPLTAEADAYLLDPTIADKVIVAWLGGNFKDMGDYNGWADPWAAYIVLKKLRLVQFPAKVFAPKVTKAQLRALPASALQNFMYLARHPRNTDPGDYDQDAPPAISLRRPDYALQLKRATFSHWVAISVGDSHDVPALRSDEHGRALVVTKADQSVATSEWWRAIRNVLSP